MRSMLERSLEKINKGYSFSINFKKRTMRIGNEFPILEGKYRGKLGQEKVGEDEFFSTLEDLYHNYRCSVPDKKYKPGYFKAKAFEELNKTELLGGERREIAQFVLEFYVLCSLLNGMEWNENWGSWFWASKNEKQLVLLKDWF